MLHEPNDETLAKLQAIVAEALDAAQRPMTLETRLDEIENIDSFSVINVFMSIEEKFGVQFTTDELSRMKTLGDIKAGIRIKQNG